MPEDIVLVTADSLRADHCGWHGGKPPDGQGPDLTPTLDGLAADGVTFTSAVAPGPRTFSSVPPTLTGEPLSVATRPVEGDDDRVRRMRAHMTAHETLAERLRELGYTTLAFTANPWTSAEVAFDRGFDEFVEVGRGGGRIHDAFKGTPLARPARLFDHWLHSARWFSQWRTFYDDILATVERVDGPTFAWVFLLDTHNPYLVPRADRHESSTLGMYAALYRGNRLFGQQAGQSTLETTVDRRTLDRLRAAYRDSVRSVDAFVDRLVTDVDATLVFHSDHGEGFGEHGTFGHQSALYEENVHVPLLVHGTGDAATVDAPLSTRTVPELIASLASDEELDPGGLTDDYAVARTLDDAGIAVRGTRWKYVRTGDEERLFDLREDPAETTDVGDEEPDRRRELRDRAESFLADLPRESVPDSSGATDEMREHLRSLGYVG